MSSASAALLMDILFGRIRDEQAGWGRGMRRRLTGLLCCFWMGSALISFSLAAAERVDNSQNPSAGPRLVTIQEFLRQANDWGEMMLVTIRGTVTHSISDRTFFI